MPSFDLGLLDQRLRTTGERSGVKKLASTFFARDFQENCAIWSVKSCRLGSISPVNSILVLSGFIVVSFAASSGGLVFRPGQWYERLEKPSWRPPNWLFAPVWTFLYFTIAVSGWLVWQQAGVEGAQLPLIVYAIQLLLNAAWSPIFFGLHRIGWALLEMALMWLSIVATMVLFYPISTSAAFLLVPYLCWVSFAFVLNYSVWRLNGDNA